MYNRVSRNSCPHEILGELHDESELCVSAKAVEDPESSVHEDVDVNGGYFPRCEQTLYMLIPRSTAGSLCKLNSSILRSLATSDLLIDYAHLTEK